MSEAELYAAMTALWEKQRRGEEVDEKALRVIQDAWVQAAAERIGKVGVKRSNGDGFHAGGKGRKRA